MISNGQYISLAYPGALHTVPFSINDNKVVIGSYTSLQGNVYYFMYNNGEFTDLNLNPQGAYLFNGYQYPIINNMNQILVGIDNMSNSIVLYQNGMFSLISVPTSLGYLLSTFGINNSGAILFESNYDGGSFF